MLSVDAEFETAQRTLAELSGGDPDVQQELAGLLADSLQRSLGGLVSAAAAGARRGVVEGAHAVRGTALTSGLAGIGALAERIETGVVPAGEVAVAVGELSVLLEQVIARLRGIGGK